MIYMFIGAIMFVVGLMFALHPAKRPNGFYGYISYLSRTNQEASDYAQKISRNVALITGVVQIFLGWLIHVLHADNYALIWLITGVLFVLPFFAVTETYLKKFLQRRGELPADYVDPDKRPKRKRTKGFRDL